MAIDDKTKTYILALYFPENLEDRISVSKIINKLEQENKVEEDKARAEGKKNIYERKWKVPSQRIIYKWIAEAKRRIAEGMEDAYQPWNILLSDKVGVPFDPILFKLLRFWFQRHIGRGEGHPFVPFSVGIAKWAVRLHIMAPFLSEKEILYRAKQYFAMERMAILAGKSPDSSYDDLEIAMKDEADQELKAAYKDFFGRKEIKLEGEEIQAQYVKISEITVPEDITERIASKKKKRTKNK